jgi:hypothetical protein
MCKLKRVREGFIFKRIYDVRICVYSCFPSTLIELGDYCTHSLWATRFKTFAVVIW